MNLRGFLALGALWWVGACATFPKADEGSLMRLQKIRGGLTMAQLEKCRSLTISKCGSCHLLYAPGDRSPKAWGEILPGMAKKAGLSPEETEQVELFLVGLAGGVKSP